LVVNDFSIIPKKEIENLVKSLPRSLHLILNFDDEEVRKISNAFTLTFGFKNGSDLQATDFYLNENGATFKLNFKGNILPIWLPCHFGREKINAVLAALAVAQVFNLNLVEVSKIFKKELSV